LELPSACARLQEAPKGRPRKTNLPFSLSPFSLSSFLLTFLLLCALLQINTKVRPKIIYLEKPVVDTAFEWGQGKKTKAQANNQQPNKQTHLYFFYFCLHRARCGCRNS
jgi:hypothetical protein